MPLPESTGMVLQYLIPSHVPLKAYEVTKRRSGIAITWHTVPVGERPSEAAINAAAVSAEFATWLADRTDPAKNVKRLAREWLQSNEPMAVALRAAMTEMGASLRELRTAQGKPNRTDQQFLGDVISKHLQ